MPCLASVRIQSSISESGVRPNLAMQFERELARNREVGSHERQTSSPAHGSSRL